MNNDDFRRAGYATIDWIADYYERIEKLPVRAQVAPGDVRARLPAAPPMTGEPFEALLRDTDEILLPGITHWQSPKFFAYFPSNSSGPSILGELVSAALGVQGMLWVTSPACTELETHVLDWLVEMLDLPPAFRGGGVIQDSASSSVLCALLAARHRGVRKVYATSQTHSSLEKAVMVAGLGRDALRLVDIDDVYAMKPSALEAMLAADPSPSMVVATVGTTSSMALDPVRAIGEICKRHGAWLHVDAAMCGTAALCPELRFVHDGVELADSYCFNPHKWMLVNVDCSCLYVADPSALTGALRLTPEYLKNPASDASQVIDYRDWQVPLARRFRALKLWFVIRHYGVEGLRRHVREHVRLARDLARRVGEDPDFELAAPASLNLVCFRHRGGDALNERLLEALNASGEMYLSHTRLDGRYTLRLAIGHYRTTEAHVLEAWRMIRATARALR